MMFNFIASVKILSVLQPKVLQIIASGFGLRNKDKKVNIIVIIEITTSYLIYQCICRFIASYCKE